MGLRGVPSGCIDGCQGMARAPQWEFELVVFAVYDELREKPGRRFRRFPVAYQEMDGPSYWYFSQVNWCRLAEDWTSGILSYPMKNICPTKCHE